MRKAATITGDEKIIPDLFPTMLSSCASPQVPSQTDMREQFGNSNHQAILPDCTEQNKIVKHENKTRTSKYLIFQVATI